MGSPFQFHGNGFSTRFLLPLCTVLLLLPSVFGAEFADDNERLPVYQACQMKYGYFPPELQGKPILSSKRKIPTEPHNQGLEECQQMYYRQKFCRNQHRDLEWKNYQRICRTFNKNHLKFFAMVFGMVGCGAFLRTIQKTFKINLPYTVLLMLIGMALGTLGRIHSICPEWSAYTNVARTPPNVILYVFLPVLIFESSFNMKSHLFFRSFISISILALPGMIITTLSTALICKLSFVTYNWSYWDALLFGSIISATDPVAVVSILKEVGTSEKLGMVVDGESLLNDGVAILFTNIFSDLVDYEDFNPTAKVEGLGSLDITLKCLRIIIGGPVIGWIIAKISILYLQQIYNDAAVEVSVTLCAAYLTYFIAEAFLNVSGVMALVFLGITISSERTCISPDVQGLVSHFWEILTYLTNTVLFVLVGIVITETAANHFKPEDGYYLIYLYFALNIIRLAMLGILSPLLCRIGYGMSWQDMVVMTWGGSLRGAVGICLALQVYKNKTICHRENVGPKMLLHTAGIIILTLTVNGTTTKKLLDVLKLTELSMGRIQDMANATRQIRSAQHRSLRILRHDRFLSDADWEIVEESTNVVNPYVEMKVRAKDQEDDLGETPSLLLDIKVDGEKIHQCPNCDTEIENEPSPDEVRELTEEARLRLLKALKVSCWRQYEQGILTEEAVQVLTDLLEKTEDRKYIMVHASDFNKYWEVSGFFFWLRAKMQPYTTGSFEAEEYRVPKEPWRHIFHRIATSLWFSLLIYLVIIANMVPAFMEAYYNTLLRQFTYEEHLYFYLTNVGFTLIYLLEFFVKVSGIGFGEYMNSKWNMADLIILIITMVEVILSGTYLKDELSTASRSQMVTRNPSAQEADFLKFVRFVRLARVTRIFRFLKPLIPIVMKYLNTKVNKKIFHSYDVAKGFVVAVDDVQKFLPQMIDNFRILLKFKLSLELQRIEVIRQMGLLQKEHPGIAIAVKTRHASRAVLNHMKESIGELKEDGLIDEKEYVCLIEELEQKMKHIWDSPAYMKPPMAELTLANVAWMSVSQSGAKELYEFIYKQASLLTYMAGDVICEAGDRANGVYVIVSGLLKIQFEPTFQTVTERESYGVVPNVEVCSDITFETEMGDFFTTGAVIGEIGVLTDQPRGGRVVCETGATLYHIPHSVMKQAIESFRDPYDSLEARIWRTVGMRLAASLLPTEPSFSSWTMDKVKTYLELSAVPIGERYKELIVPNFVSDVVVIYGQVCNHNDMEEIFTAPCVIPKTVEHLAVKPNTAVPARLLIIASQDVEHWAESDDEEDEDSNGSYRGRMNGSNKGSDTSLQKFIIAGTKAGAITEEEALGIQLHRQSRAVNFGVVTTKSLQKSKSKESMKP